MPAPPPWALRWQMIGRKVLASLAYGKIAVGYLTMLMAFPAMRDSVIRTMGTAAKRTLLQDPLAEVPRPKAAAKDDSVKKQARCAQKDSEGQQTVKRYGTAHGRFTTCAQCDARWKWEPSAAGG